MLTVVRMYIFEVGDRRYGYMKIIYRFMIGVEDIEFKY